MTDSRLALRRIDDRCGFLWLAGTISSATDGIEFFTDVVRAAAMA